MLVIPCPVGTNEVSPVIYRWERIHKPNTSPVGTAEPIYCAVSAVLTGLCVIPDSFPQQWTAGLMSVVPVGTRFVPCFRLSQCHSVYGFMSLWVLAKMEPCCSEFQYCYNVKKHFHYTYRGNVCISGIEISYQLSVFSYRFSVLLPHRWYLLIGG